ncbi:hypothetical protein [Sphingobacterium corticis]
MANSQTVAEWLRQKSTQKRYLIQQIGAAHAYAEQLSAGYRIITGGLSIINALQRGEFDLHKKFFNDRKSPSPYLRTDKRIDQIMVLQRDILLEQRHCARLLSKSNLADGRIAYVRRVMTRVGRESQGDLADLSTLFKSGAFELDDADRLSRLQAIYQQTLQRHTFTKHLTRWLNVLVLGKQYESREIHRSIILHN